MTIPEPSALARHQVTWPIGWAGDTPGPLAGARGHVTFTASATVLAYSDATVLPEAVTTPIVDGVMAPVDLIENDPEIWNWRVTPRVGVAWDSFHIDVTGPVNVASAATTPGVGPVRVVRGDQGYQGASLVSLTQIDENTLRSVIEDPVTGTTTVQEYDLPIGPVGPYGGTEVTDPQVASYVETDTETRAALSSTVGQYRASDSRVLDGSRLLTVGDSISWIGTPGAQGHTWLTATEYGSGGRLRLYASTAVSGSASPQQLTAVRDLIAAGGVLPTMATVLVGANDLGGSGNHEASFPGWSASVTAIAAELRAAGIEPVLCTLVPRSGPVTPQLPSVINGTWNAWLRSHAQENGYLLADLWRAVADPATGEWPAGWADPADGVHPLTPGHNAMAVELQRVVYPRLALAPEVPKVRRLGDGNLIGGGIITSAAMPSAWLTPTGTGHTYEPDPDAPGLFAAQITAADPATAPDFRVRSLSSEGTWMPGDEITAVVRWRIEHSKDVTPGRGVRAYLDFYNGAIRQRTDEMIYGQRVPTDDYQTVLFDTNIPPDTTDMRLLFQYSKGNSPTSNEMVVRLAAWGIYNRTRGQWATGQ